MDIRKNFVATGIMLCTLLQPSSSQDVRAIDRILAAYGGESPGASLLIVRDGQVLLQRHYGYADLENKQPVSAATNFRLASVSKQFTAACILQLVHQGKLDLSTTIPEAFPEFPAYGNAVTVKHLLTHTSGIPDYEDYVADTAFNPQIKDSGVLDILIQLDSGYFAPGTQHRYSNSGYALLALMVEHYSSQSFAAYLREHIFIPLGMTSTVAHEAEKTTVPARAFGYSLLNGQWKRRDQSATSAVLGDGGIYSNVMDLAIWDQALYGEDVLPAHWINESFACHKLANGDNVPYGYGWHLKKTNSGEQVVYHTGSSTSFRNIFYRIPSRRFSIILLTNRNQPQEEDMLTLAEQVADLIFL
ncbi:serine hydrolase domain-containing protein [Parapedobacter deserti]|uniref:Serine hydrolase domain-containing protein n=1 Tax=Parapedobacter deserti TaxID=1912957 RepID=A0ABV7JQY9_9SPHI